MAIFDPEYQVQGDNAWEYKELCKLHIYEIACYSSKFKFIPLAKRLESASPHKNHPADILSSWPHRLVRSLALFCSCF